MEKWSWRIVMFIFQFKHSSHLYILNVWTYNYYLVEHYFHILMKKKKCSIAFCVHFFLPLLFHNIPYAKLYRVHWIFMTLTIEPLQICSFEFWETHVNKNQIWLHLNILWETHTVSFLKTKTKAKKMGRTKQFEMVSMNTKVCVFFEINIYSDLLIDRIVFAFSTKCVYTNRP